MFTVGEKYQNIKGVFTVKEDKGDKIRVEYVEDGSSAIMLKAIAEKNAVEFIPASATQWDKESFTSIVTPAVENFYATLGFLMNHAEIVVFVPEKSKQKFETDFYNAKGIMPEGKEYFVHAPDKKKWGLEIKVVWDACFNNMVKVNFPFTIHGQGKSAICNNEFAMRLFSLGFGIGKNHDKNTIINNVPVVYKEEFIQGGLMSPSAY